MVAAKHKFTTSPASGRVLERYDAKRNFSITPEPKGVRAKPRKALSFVIQKHWASHLHYDFRLELDGVLLSWAVPKGPSCDPKQKRMAIHVEDHPVSYANFEGKIPAGQYGAGDVIVWDRGTWEPTGDAGKAMSSGKLLFRLHGEKLAGLWELVRTSRTGDQSATQDKRQEKWLLLKKPDEWARAQADHDVIVEFPDSVIAKPLGPIERRNGGAASPSRRHKEAEAPPGKPARTANAAATTALPAKLQPQLATLIKGGPPAGDWLYEIKFDGYRIMARIENGKARLMTRGSEDWTARMPSLSRDIESLELNSAWLDGEVVVLDEQGVPNFNALQNAFNANAFDGGKAGLTYFIFDVPFFEGHDLRSVSLHERRDMLKKLLATKRMTAVRFSEDFLAEASSVLQSACRMGLEGIIAKRQDAPYVSGRTDTWLKLKCSARQEFVIVGFIERTNAPGEVGSLLLGYHENGKLQYAGNVGTGWNTETRIDLHRRLTAIEVAQAAIDSDTKRDGHWSQRPGAVVRWVKPELVAEISFSEWTPDKHIRHASFQGLRTDKAARSVTREIALRPSRGSLSATRHGKASSSTISSKKAMQVTHANRVIDPSSGLTKLDLVRYYESVTEWVLPHLKGRPVSLLRAPQGIAGPTFFQKHDDTLGIPGLRELDASLWPGHARLIEVADAAALLGAAQMNAVEFHTWNSTTKKIDKPDRIVFDLDPGEGVPWQQVREAATVLRVLLAELGLQCWLKTSGGKGLHVVVPILPRLDHGAIKGFSQALVRHLAKIFPTRFVAKSGSHNRINRIFIDYLRNGHGQTTVAAFSVRARPGLGVSMPVNWDQLPQIDSGAQWTIATAREYLSFQKRDPWASYWHARQTLTKAFRLLGYEPARRDTA